MPIIQGFKTLRGDRESRQLIEGLPVADVHRTFTEWVGAGFRQENLGLNLLNYLRRETNFGEFDPDYEVWEDPLVSGQALADPYSFSGVSNRREALAIAERLDRTRADEVTLQHAGGWGYVAGFAGGVLSPENLIPVSWIGRVGRGVQTASRAARGVGVTFADDAARLGVKLTDNEIAAFKAGKSGQSVKTPVLGLSNEEVSLLTDAPAARLRPARAEATSSAREVADRKIVNDVLARDAAQKAAVGKAQQERAEGLATLLGPEERQLQNALEEFRTAPGATAARAPIKARIDRHRANLARARADYIKATPIPKVSRALSEAEQQAVNRVKRRALGRSPEGPLGVARDLRFLETARDAVMAKISKQVKSLNESRQALLEAGPTPVSVLGATGSSAAVATTVGTLSEVVLQATQEGRDEEILANVFVASAGLGAVFGAVGGSMARYGNRRLKAAHEALVDELTGGPLFERLPDRLKLTPEEFRDLTPDQIDARVIEMIRQHSPGEAELLVGGKPRAAKVKEDGTIEPGSGFDTGPVTEKHKLVGEDVPLFGKLLRWSMHVSPGGRLLKNKRMDSIRAFARRMTPTPYMLRGQGEGPSLAAKIVAHSQMGAFHANEVSRLRGKQDRTLWNRQLARHVRGGGKLEGEALMPGVEEASGLLTRYFGEMEARLAKAGLLPEGGVDLGADKAYLPRILDQDALITNRDKALALFTRKLGNAEDAQKLYDELTALRYDSFKTDAYNLTGRTTQLKDRGLKDISSSELEEFLIDDIEYLITRYARNVGPQLEYGKIFTEGTVTERLNMTAFEKEVTDHYDELRRAAPEGRARNRIEAEFKEVMTDLKFVREHQLGDLARDPFEALPRAVSDVTTKAASFLYLGGAGFGSLGDAVAGAFVTGAPTFFKTGMNRLRKRLLELRALDGDELKVQAQLLEWVGQDHSRAGYFSSFARQGATLPQNVKKSGFRGRLESTHNAFMVLNLLRPVTAFSRGFQVQGGQHKLLSIGRKLDEGGVLSRQEENVLKVAGISEKQAKAFGKQIRGGKGVVENEKILLAKVSEWDDELGFEFRSAVNQLSMAGILNPGAVEVPSSMSSSLGSIFFQFMGPVFAGHSNLLVSGIQRHDSAVFAGALGLLGMGMFIEAVREVSRTGEVPELNDLVVMGMERSGMVGVVDMLNSRASRLTGGVLDYANLLGAETAVEKYGPIEDLGDAIPGFRAFEDAKKLARTSVRLATGEDISEAEAKAFARRIPVMRGVQFTPVRQGIADFVESK